METRKFEHLSIDELNELIFCVGKAVNELKDEFRSFLRDCIYSELYEELTLRISVEAQREEIELVASYIDLKSVNCVIDDCSLDVHPVDETGKILDKKFNLLEDRNSEWTAKLSDYDRDVVNKLIDEA